MNVVQPLAAIVLVMALLGGALLLLKKRGAVSLSGTARRRLEVIERISLGPHHSLHLVRAGGTAPVGCDRYRSKGRISCQLLTIRMPVSAAEPPSNREEDAELVDAERVSRLAAVRPTTSSKPGGIGVTA